MDLLALKGYGIRNPTDEPGMPASFVNHKSIFGILQSAHTIKPSGQAWIDGSGFPIPSRLPKRKGKEIFIC